MSRAYKCEICDGLFAGEPSAPSVPIKLKERVIACLDFAVMDVCPKCQQQVKQVAACLLQEEVKDGR